MDIEDSGREEVSKGADKSLEEFFDAIRKDPELLDLEWEDLCRKWKPERDEELERSVYEILLKSWLLGMRHGTEDRYGKEESDFADFSASWDLSFEDAVKFAGARVPLTPTQYRKLSDDVRNYAFTVSRLTQLDMVRKAQKIYRNEWQQSGASLDRFVSDMTAAFGEKVGFKGYYELVYRTNIQKDYNAGKAMQIMADPPLFLEFVGIDDERQTDICHACSGVVLPADDPWWDSHWPPLHFNCRSTVREIFRDEAEERGLLEDGYDFEGQLDSSGIGEAEGSFGINPARNESFWTATPSMQERIISSLIQDELNGMAGATVAKDFEAPKAGYVQVETKAGGLRAVPDAEVVDAAKTLADAGWYVEIGKDSAWLNGIERAVFSSTEGGVEKAIRSSLRKAQTVVLSASSKDLKELAGLSTKARERLFARGIRQLLAVVDGEIIQLSRADLLSDSIQKLESFI